MRSSPLLSLTVTLAGFGLLAWPLVLLTAPREHLPADEIASGTVSRANEHHVACRVRILTSRTPAALSLTCEDVALFRFPPAAPAASGNSRKAGAKQTSGQAVPAFPVEFTCQLPVIPGSTLEIPVSASWQGASGAIALTVIIEPDGLDPVSATLWTDYGQLDDVLAFPVPAAP